jgi:hypothetical protein
VAIEEFSSKSISNLDIGEIQEMEVLKWVENADN